MNYPYKLTRWGNEFGHFLSVNLGQPQSLTFFAEIFRQQIDTLQKIEEDDGMDSNVHAQVFFFT